MLLAIDIGSSSVKAALLDGDAIVGEVAATPFATRFEGDRAEVDAEAVDAAIAAAVGQLNLADIEAIGLTGMGPAWLAMDDRSRAITPIVTHQDRRSLEQARAIEAAVGRERHLALAGNRPTPGGISSTVARWFVEQGDIGKATMVGHLPTYVGHRLTGRWAIDPSNAGFSGLMDVATGAWSEELCAAAKVPIAKLPAIVDAATPIGVTVPNPYGLSPSLPVFGGFVDGSGMLLAAGATAGTLGHSAGSTDVLALCLDRPMPRDGLLCRPLGTGGLWVSAATQAAGGAAVGWARRLMFGEMSDADFARAFRRAADSAERDGPRFDPRLAGDRQQVDQPTAALAGLTLSHDRHAVLAAIVRALVDDHLARLARLLTLADEAGVAVSPRVIVTGGGGALADLCHARWDSNAWRFDRVEQATLRGLSALQSAR